MNKDASNAVKELFLLKKNANKMHLAAENWKNDWQTLISIILSARTRDEKTVEVAEKLFELYPSALKLSNAGINEIESIIRQVNYYKTKSKNVIACSRKIHFDYGDKVPRNEKELLDLPGVGRKTANVFLSEIGKDAIGVDTHVSYISREFGWSKNSKPEIIEEDLKELFPKRYWKKINPILVRFGKSHVSKKQKDELIKDIKNKIED